MLSFRRKTKYLAICTLLALQLVCVSPEAGVAQAPGEPAPASVPKDDAEANAIINEFMSPFCPGRILRDCPSGAASELKQKIRDQILQGKSRADVEAFLVQMYGNQVWAAPPTSGFGLVAWLAPAVFLTLGLVFIAVWLRGKQAVKAPKTPQELSPEMLARIERELKR